ncbi:unnamed protein product [Gongylonema pulchrum]|uniref:Troponin T n=1 Tax=Gongylonema pulchrum TaxID=637853 RepID=A0A3P6QG48_9BILA|nr:unnamed protein product [Gongylonema pulchrum]
MQSLREKQERRRREREQEEKELAEKMRLAEEKRRQEEEESKIRMEAQKQKREEERRKKQAMLADSLAGIVSLNSNIPNFILQKQEKQERNGKASMKNGKSKEEKEEAKRAYMALISQKPVVSQLLTNDLKIKIQQLHAHICKLEAVKYDLEKRHERQLYDVSEFPTVEKPPPIVHGTARPPPEWGRTENEELEQLRKIIEPHKYVEQVKVENARPPIEPIPLSVPGLQG